MDNNNSNKSLDLRVVIGSFFLVISIILIVTSFIIKIGSDVNLITGIVYFIFGILMISLSKLTKRKE